MAIYNEVFGGGINAKDCTATSADILTGKTAAVGKEIVTGSMANQGAKTSTLTTNGASYTIPKGYHNGSGKVTANISNLTAANIKSGVNVGGVVGSYTNKYNIVSITNNDNLAIKAAIDNDGYLIILGNLGQKGFYTFYLVNPPEGVSRLRDATVNDKGIIVSGITGDISLELVETDYNANSNGSFYDINLYITYV